MSEMFDALGKRSRTNNNNPAQTVQQLKDDPAGFLKSRGYSIPTGVDLRSPQSIINSLVQSGQVGNGRLQQIMRMISSPKRF